MEPGTRTVHSVVAEGCADTISFPLGQGIAGSAMVSGSLEMVKDAYSDPRFDVSGECVCVLMVV